MTFEFPHLLQLFEQNQFDTIYHEHFSYFSLIAVERIFARHGLSDLRRGGALDAWRLAPHLRAATGRRRRPLTERLLALRAARRGAGLPRRSRRTRASKNASARPSARLLEVLIDAKRRGKNIVGYGAPGKGNTLLNYCGIRTDFLDFTVDRNPYKHGSFLPGTHIPIFPPEKLDEAKPDYLFILPWNLKDEIMAQLKHTRSWGGKFIVPIPEATVL